MNTYTQMQFANSLEAGAANPNGGAGAAGNAMGMGMGLAMAQQMAQQMMQPQAAPQQQAGAAVPPPLPQQKTYYVAVNGRYLSAARLGEGREHSCGFSL